MINESLQELAALYATGALTAPEREQVELLLEFHEEFRGFVGGLAETAATVVLAAPRLARPVPAPELKGRILRAISARAQQQVSSEALVMTGPDGLVRWINPAFTAMCGYTLDELRGKKPGPILQGEKTDRESVERIRRAVREFRPCQETILNYHKNGAPYWVEIAITPILGNAGQPLFLVAREKELTDRAAA